MKSWRHIVIALCWPFCWLLVGAAASAEESSSLRDDYQRLRPEFAHSPFGKPIQLESHEGNDTIAGAVYAVLDVPYATTARTLSQPQRWCQILFLHPNTKYCRVRNADSAPEIELRVGKKYDQPVEQAYQLLFDYRIVTHAADRLHIELDAHKGPLGTHDYRIALEAIPVEGGKTFLHFSYAYTYGTVAHLAMETYLNTVGHDKVGFTVEGRTDDGKPRYVAGMRGLVERNTMRYYLALDVFLHYASGAGATAAERRLRTWFAAAERYPQQLHDMSLDQYLTVKRDEYRREHEQGGAL